MESNLDSSATAPVLLKVASIKRRSALFTEETAWLALGPGCHQFARYMEEETQLPVVAIWDDYDQPTKYQSTIANTLMGGAMLCLIKPLTNRDIKKLWQIPQRLVKAKSCQFPMMGNLEVMRGKFAQEFSGLQMCDIQINDSLMRKKYQKRKADELDRTNGWPVGQSSSAVWTPDVMHKVLDVENLAVCTTSVICCKTVAHK